MVLGFGYGLMSFTGRDYVHNFGATLGVGVGAGRLDLTAGYFWPNCERVTCTTHFMAGGSYGDLLTSVAVGRSEASASVNVGLDLGVGFAKAPDATLLAAAASLPVALIPRGRRVRLFPYVAPGLGVGLADDDRRTEAGMRPRIALGLGLLGSRIGMTVVLDRVLFSGGNWLAGFSASYSATGP
jgi:hypothetical protein